MPSVSVSFTRIIINYSREIPENKSVILINEIQSGVIYSYPDKYKVTEINDAFESLDIEPFVIEPEGGEKTVWTDKNTMRYAGSRDGNRIRCYGIFQ